MTLVLEYDPFKYGPDGEIVGVKPINSDPRCLYGWGPADRTGCRHSTFGHGCHREFGHQGRCVDIAYEASVKCSRRQRPADWDTRQREECNR